MHSVTEDGSVLSSLDDTMTFEAIAYNGGWAVNPACEIIREHPRLNIQAHYLQMMTQVLKLTVILF